MSAINPQLRDAVAARADHRCEYCGIPDRLQVGGFELDHITPRSRGGQTTLENLAYACPHCNGQKSDHVQATDAASRSITELFNPRTQRCSDHFRWSVDRPFEIEGITACGRAAVGRLDWNHREMVAIRRTLDELGLAAKRLS